MIIIPPFRLKCLIALTDIIKSVTPANGYQMDLSDEADGAKRVQRGRLIVGDDDPSTLVTIIEPPTAVEPQQTGPDNTGRATEWDILIQGWAKNDKDNEAADLAYVLAADVTKALAAEKQKTKTGRPGVPDLLGMGGKVIDIRIGTSVVRPTEDLTDYGVFFLILTLKISEDMANPFG